MLLGAPVGDSDDVADIASIRHRALTLNVDA
jgi:hypothetical protein